MRVLPVKFLAHLWVHEGGINLQMDLNLIIYLPESGIIVISRLLAWTLGFKFEREVTDLHILVFGVFNIEKIELIINLLKQVISEYNSHMYSLSVCGACMWVCRYPHEETGRKTLDVSLYCSLSGPLW